MEIKNTYFIFIFILDKNSEFIKFCSTFRLHLTKRDFLKRKSVSYVLNDHFLTYQIEE